MDRSKLGKIVGGVFCKQLFVKLSFRLKEHCSIFQAEMLAIDAVLRRIAPFREASVHSTTERQNKR